MGTLLEVLWAFEANNFLRNNQYQNTLAWLGDQYNDFALLGDDGFWDSTTRTGELLRIEMKTMDLDADESKAHFDGLDGKDISPKDMILVVYWRWISVDNDSRAERFPRIIDHFFGRASELAFLRDELHIARGGTFVDRNSCPDQCPPSECEHHGEPLNASGNREKISGPESRRVSRNVSYAANFGGMTRMLGVKNQQMKTVLHRLRRENDTVHRYLSFVHNNQPKKELSMYSRKTWLNVANQLGISNTKSMKKNELYAEIKNRHNHTFRDLLRNVR